MEIDWKRAQKKSVHTARWSTRMAKVRISQLLGRTRWQFVTFSGPAGRESAGIVDLIAIRKDHGHPTQGTKKGDNFQIILIQIKGGSAPMPNAEDGERLRAVARRHRAQQVLLATWKKGKCATFRRLRPRHTEGLRDWIEVEDQSSIFK